jgi:hypothetical protein
MSENGNIILPEWFDGKKINEALFCAEFIRDFPMITINDTFFTVNGRVTDENRLKKEIYNRIKPYVTSGIAKRVTGLLDVMRMECCTASLPLFQDRIHVKNGTYYLDGTFSEKKDFCRNRLPVAYNPDAPEPETWLRFLSELLMPEDIPTLQEFMGYCFIPSTKGQKMLRRVVFTSLLRPPLSRKITLPGIVIFRDNYTRTEHICNQATLQISSVLLSPKSGSAAHPFPTDFAPVAPFRASGHKRYNTLDFASKIVCQVERCSPMEPHANRPFLTPIG